MGRDSNSLSVEILTKDCHHLFSDEGWKQDANDDNNSFLLAINFYKNYGDEDEDEDDLQLISDDLQLFHHHVTTYNFCLILTTYL